MTQSINADRGSVRPKSTRDVVAHLRRNGIRDTVLNAGGGFFCFEGPATEDWIDHTVRVSFLGDLTLDQWLQTYQAMASNPTNQKSILSKVRVEPQRKKVKYPSALPDPDTATMSPEELCHRIFWLTREVMTFWSDGGWAIAETAALLQRSSLPRQVSVAASLKQWVQARSDGDLVLAWANLGALVEGQLKLGLCVYYQDYKCAADAIRKKSGALIDPDEGMLEALRQFFAKNWWLDSDNWNEYVTLVMQRRNAIHAFDARTIGTFSEWKAQLPSHLSFMRAINGRLPYPDGGEEGPSPPRDEKGFPLSKLR